MRVKLQNKRPTSMASQKQPSKLGKIYTNSAFKQKTIQSREPKTFTKALKMEVSNKRRQRRLQRLEPTSVPWDSHFLARFLEQLVIQHSHLTELKRDKVMKFINRLRQLIIGTNKLWLVYQLLTRTKREQSMANPRILRKTISLNSTQILNE